MRLHKYKPQAINILKQASPYRFTPAPAAALVGVITNKTACRGIALSHEERLQVITPARG